MESTSKFCLVLLVLLVLYTILTLWSQLQNVLPDVDSVELRIPYWLCGVNFKIRLALCPGSWQVYHIDSVESTSKSPARCTKTPSPIPYWLCGVNFKIHRRPCIVHRVIIPYWLCGVNFKMPGVSAIVPAYYTILTLWSQLQNSLNSCCAKNVIYHIDSVESTSKSEAPLGCAYGCYTILTLWSQLQNNFTRASTSGTPIPYWLCGVNFKIKLHRSCGWDRLYHIDSVESTSKFRRERCELGVRYTILTLWSQLQNSLLPSMRGQCRYTILTLWSQLQNADVPRATIDACIPYWLCGVNFKILVRKVLVHAAYTILTLWSQLQNNSLVFDNTVNIIPYWLCGVNFKIGLFPSVYRRFLYHIDSVESTSKCHESS